MVRASFLCFLSVTRFFFNLFYSIITFFSFCGIFRLFQDARASVRTGSYAPGYARGCKLIAKRLYSLVSVSHGRCSVVVNCGLTFHRATASRIRHRKVQRGLQVQSKTIFNFLTGVTNLWNYGPRNLRNLRNLTKITYFDRNIYFQ